MNFADFAELANFAELARLMEKRGSLPPLANLHPYTEHYVHGIEYFCWPVWAGCPAVLPPGSCRSAR